MRCGRKERRKDGRKRRDGGEREREDKKRVKERIGMKITDVSRKVDNQKETGALVRGCYAEGTEKIAAATVVYQAYILSLNPREFAGGTKRAKNDSHFYSRAEDEYKAGADTFFICRYIGEEERKWVRKILRDTRRDR